MAVVTLQAVAQTVDVHRTTVARALRGDRRISARTRRRVLGVARQLGYDFSRLRVAHTREAVRVSVDLSVKLEIHLRDGTVHARGSARVTNLNIHGARLTDLNMAPKSLPLEPFRFRIEFLNDDLLGVGLWAETVHVATRQEIELGVRFVTVNRRETRRRLEWWLRQYQIEAA